MDVLRSWALFGGGKLAIRLILDACFVLLLSVVERFGNGQILVLGRAAFLDLWRVSQSLHEVATNASDSLSLQPQTKVNNSLRLATYHEYLHQKADLLPA